MLAYVTSITLLEPLGQRTDEVGGDRVINKAVLLFSRVRLS